jgi:hypothetical protein
MREEPYALLPLWKGGGKKQGGRTVAHAKIDPEYETWVNQWRWHLARSGYVVRWERRLPDEKSWEIRLHRELLRLTAGDGFEVDHYDRDRLNNRLSNLRTSRDRHMNAQNQPSHGRTSRYRGVYWDRRRGRWYASAKLNGRSYFLGRFRDEADAAKAARSFRSAHMPYATD